MKKSKINLLTNREDYNKIESFFRLLRIVLVFLILIFVLVFIFFFMKLIFQMQRVQTLTNQKKALLDSIQGKENSEAKILYIQNKYRSIKKDLTEDANSLPYYNLLNSTLSTSTESAALKSFAIDKNRDFTFTVAFQNFSSLLNFFKFIESDNFLKNFEKISLKSFSSGEEKSNEKSNYQLSFSGRFILIKNENTN